MQLAVIFLCFLLVVFVQAFDQFDFIIVGSGAAGSIVAARLANESDSSVLVLEAGGKATGQRDVGGTDYVASIFTRDPVTGTQVLDPVPLTRYDVPGFMDSTRLSPALNNTWAIEFVGNAAPQSKVVGGNMVTNGLNWIYPPNEDFDAWNIPGYSGRELRHYFMKMENATATGYTDGRGKSGPIRISYPSFISREHHLFKNACIAAGFSDGGDINSEVTLPGIYSIQANSYRGIRDSTSSKYLAPVLKARTNIQLWTDCTVTRIIFDDHNYVAMGVEYVDKYGIFKQVYARKEVILAAGTLQIPHILFNSGIGPASVLQAFHKPHVVVNDLIGQQIRTQQTAFMVYDDKDQINANFFATPHAFIEYAENGTGILDGRGGWWLKFKALSSHPYPDIIAQGGLVASVAPSSLYGQMFYVTINLNHNLYKHGTLNLTSSNPLSPPKFVANAFAEDEDSVTLAHAILRMREIIAFRGGDFTEIWPGTNFTTVEQLAPWVRHLGFSASHYAGSVPMGIDLAAPTDIRMRLRGVQKVRIVGPATNPGKASPGMQALACVLGEKATDLIKEDHGL